MSYLPFTIHMLAAENAEHNCVIYSHKRVQSKYGMLKCGTACRRLRAKRIRRMNYNFSKKKNLTAQLGKDQAIALEMEQLFL